MIGWLQGKLLAKKPPALLVNVAGVGYELEAPMTTFYDLSEVGEDVTLFIHHQVREDAQNLYAFGKEQERDVFRMLLKVNGVGAKLALVILSGMDAQTLGRCVFEGDTASLSKLPGIGKKTAERLIIEMRDRLDSGPLSATSTGTGTEAPRVMREDPVREAISALVSLGFKPQDASRQVHAVETADLSSEQMVRLALKTMVR
jgi:Holliday junction DNA helicase RuvA